VEVRRRRGAAGAVLCASFRGARQGDGVIVDTRDVDPAHHHRGEEGQEKRELPGGHARVCPPMPLLTSRMARHGSRNYSTRAASPTAAGTVLEAKLPWINVAPLPPLSTILLTISCVHGAGL